MKFAKYLLSLGLVFFVSGCVTEMMPGTISQTQSKFDNSTELSMSPASVYRDNDGFSGHDIQLSLFWNSNLPKNQLILEAYVSGAHAFARGKSLFFNVDGKIYSFGSIDNFTDIDLKRYRTGPTNLHYQNESSKRYLISIDFIEEINSAESVIVKVQLRKSYVEGVFSDSTFGSAKNSFEKFLEKLRTITTESAYNGSQFHLD